MKYLAKRALNVVMLLSLVASALLVVAKPVSAGSSIQVTTTIDENGNNLNACSIREAVISANENKSFGGCTSGSAGMDVIYVPADTRKYALTVPDPVSHPEDSEEAAYKGDLDITDSVQIIGAGRETSIIASSGTARDRVFHIRTNKVVIFDNIGIVDGNSVAAGGGIYVEGSAQLTLNRVRIYKNTATVSGGGLMIRSLARVNISRSEISENTAPQAGGIVNEGVLNLDSSLILSNHGTDTTGGISSNTQDPTDVTRITNSTITQNTVPAGSPSGAGITAFSTSYLILLNSTIADNLGIGLEIQSGASGTVKNTIIARQKVGTIDKPNCSLPGTTGFSFIGHNLVSDSSCGVTAQEIATLDALGLDGNLSNNGGATLTYALSPDSPAVDRGDNTGCPSADQRMYGRPALGKVGNGLNCDIGAYELNGSLFQSFLPLVRR